MGIFNKDKFIKQFKEEGSLGVDINVYAFKDLAIGSFDKPFFDTNEPMKVAKMTARRVKISTPQELLKSRLVDLELFYLGSYNDKSGVFKSDVKKLLVCADYVDKEAAAKAVEIRNKEVEDYVKSVQAKVKEESK